MDNTLLLMKVIAVAHGVIGYIAVGFTLSPEFQDEVIYKGRNPLVGDVRKYLTYGMCLSLVLCGFCPWFKPSATPLWAWLALGFHLLSSLFEIAIQRGHVWCGRCMVTGTIVKTIAAVALTYLAAIHASAAGS